MIPAALTALVVLLVPLPATTAGPPDDDPLTILATREGSVQVILRLDVPFRAEGGLSEVGQDHQRQEIGDERVAIIEELAGTGSQVVRTYQSVPFVAVELTLEGLGEARRSSHVVSIAEDVALAPTLAQSVPLVQAPQMWAAGYTGAGRTVAVLDTGIASTHPFLAGKVVEEACYSARRDCPNGAMSQTGQGAGAPCRFSIECNHGTHVAGIVAGSGGSFSGVAKGAQLMSVQVFSEFTGGADCGVSGTCALALTSDLIKGLERVYALRTQYAFAAVNISIAGDAYSTYCDADPLKPAIDNLRTAGIPTIVSSGNDGLTSAISSPACISSAVSVGSTTDTGTEPVAPYSNSAWFLSLLAPGSFISSSVPGGTFESMAGTSMAAPHVAGAWALMKEKDPSASVSQILSALQSTGLPIYDPRNGVTTPRIRVHTAAFGSPTTGAGAPSVTLVLWKHLFASGALSADGFAACSPVATITIQRRVAKKWRLVKTITTGDTGGYKTRIADRVGKYRALAAALTPGGESSCAAATSPTRRHKH